jgi:hypothetical protein
MQTQCAASVASRLEDGTHLHKLHEKRRVTLLRRCHVQKAHENGRSAAAVLHHARGQKLATHLQGYGWRALAAGKVLARTAG